MTPTALRDWRKSHDMTQVELADALDMSRRAIAGYEAGEHPIPLVVELALYGLVSPKRKTA